MMECNIHLGYLLLRDQMPPLLALFLNLDASHTFAEEIPEKEFNSNCPWLPPDPPGWVALMVSCISASES